MAKFDSTDGTTRTRSRSGIGSRTSSTATTARAATWRRTRRSRQQVPEEGADQGQPERHLDLSPPDEPVLQGDQPRGVLRVGGRREEAWVPGFAGLSRSAFARGHAVARAHEVPAPRRPSVRAAGVFLIDLALAGDVHASVSVFAIGLPVPGLAGRLASQSHGRRRRRSPPPPASGRTRDRAGAGRRDRGRSQWSARCREDDVPGRAGRRGHRHRGVRRRASAGCCGICLTLGQLSTRRPRDERPCLYLRGPTTRALARQVPVRAARRPTCRRSLLDQLTCWRCCSTNEPAGARCSTTARRRSTARSRRLRAGFRRATTAARPAALVGAPQPPAPSAAYAGSEPRGREIAPGPGRGGRVAGP